MKQKFKIGDWVKVVNLHNPYSAEDLSGQIGDVYQIGHISSSGMYHCTDETEILGMGFYPQNLEKASNQEVKARLREIIYVKYGPSWGTRKLKKDAQGGTNCTDDIYTPDISPNMCWNAYGLLYDRGHWAEPLEPSQVPADSSGWELWDKIQTGNNADNIQTKQTHGRIQIIPRQTPTIIRGERTRTSGLDGKRRRNPTRLGHSRKRKSIIQC